MKTSQIMLWVMGALVPGLAAMTYVLGLGVLWNLAILSLVCVLCEGIIAKARGKSFTDVFHQLQDCSALVTAWLIAICLPPYCQIGILCLAAVSAIGLAKQAYGGLGKNLFNPAMVGYAVILVSFPQALANWPDLADSTTDALSGATLLTEFRYRQGLTTEEFVYRVRQCRQRPETHRVQFPGGRSTPELSAFAGLAYTGRYVCCRLAGKPFWLRRRIIRKPRVSMVPLDNRRLCGCCLFYCHRPGNASAQSSPTDYIWCNSGRIYLPDPRLWRLP